jgi:hypothetical protein
VLVFTLACASAGGVAACQAKGEPRAVEVVLHDEHDAAILTLTRTAVGCTAEPGALVFTAAGTTTSGNGWSLGPGPAGPELRSSSGTVARVVTDETPAHRLSIIDSIGVPMVRLTFGADGVNVADAARAVVGRIENGADGVRFVPADDRTGGRVTGAADVALADRFTIAAPLLAPAPLPLPARALLACERLAAVTPAPK